MATNTRKLAALLGSSGANITDAGTINTAGITADAIDNTKIADNAVNADSIAANAVGTSEVADNVLTATDLAANSVGESELSVDYTAQSVPHIIPGVLYPGYNDKQIDGTTALAASTTGPAGSTVASSKFGTVQSDGRMYYYTDIKGSKPIKDPRIGAHFGSQRHLFKSVQLREEESSIQGNSVYSIDGRDWIRACATDKEFDIGYDQNGSYVKCLPGNTSSFFEIVGYFNGVNFSGFTHTTRGAEFSVNGGSVSTSNFFTTNVMTPIRDRHVSHGSYLNLTNSLTLGINTIKIIPEGVDDGYWYGIELIVQDLSGSGSPNRSKIQIPAQNVVSAGKKFAISATADHYDPFSAKTDGSAWTSPTSGTNNANSAASWPTNIDTTYSLGLDKWVDGSSYYRPYNGGRVVKYVDSTGTIKTAVTVMPPNAKSFKDDDVNKKAKNAGNTTHLPTFESHTTDIYEDNLHELAATFYYREYGNGSNNAGSGSTNHPDASMLVTSDNVAFVMDDGLTSMAANKIEVAGGGTTSGNANAFGYVWSASDSYDFYTFIGTGWGFRGKTSAGDDHHHIVQNLPYGTHVIGQTGATGYPLAIDSQAMGNHRPNNRNTDAGVYETFIYQPKKPPIPEDAVVIADYMLFADHIKQTDAANGSISKGVRFVSGSRDWFYNNSGSNNWTSTVHQVQAGGETFSPLRTTPHNSGTSTSNLPFFGTTGEAFVSTQEQAWSITLGGSAATENKLDNSVTGSGDVITIDETVALGSTNIEITFPGGYLWWGGAVATPIHTSHHYQSFETPYIRELIGGDRNMEQTNLVCSPEGKTWDEVTRDTSYIGNQLVKCDHNTEYTNATYTFHVFDEWRGNHETYEGPRFSKDFAIAQDRLICLKDGQYMITYMNRSDKNDDMVVIQINAALVKMHKSTVGLTSAQNTVIVPLKRGDHVKAKGVSGQSGVAHYNVLVNFQIAKV